MQRFYAIRHPEPLSVDSVNCSPIDSGGACTERLVDAVAKANVLDEGESFGQNEADLDPLHAVARGRIRGRGASSGVRVRLSSTRLYTASHEQTYDLSHDLLERPNVLWCSALRKRRWCQHRIFFALAVPPEHGCVAIRTEQRSEKFTHQRNRAGFFKDELRQGGGLMNAPASAHSGERGNRGGELHWQDDRPFARVVACPKRTLPGDQLDVIERGFTIQRLAEVHAPLTQDADRAVADQMTDQPGEGQSASAFMLVGKAETHRTRMQLVAV